MYKKIEKLEKQLNKISEELKSLKKEEQDWPQFGDKCFYFNDFGEVYDTEWKGDCLNRARLEMGGLFKTKKGAKDRVKALKIETAIAKRRKELNGDWVPDWGGAQNNYHIYLRYWESEGKPLRVDCTGNYVFTTAFGFYKSRDDVRTIIEEFEEELLWYFTEYLPSIN